MKAILYSSITMGQNNNYQNQDGFKDYNSL